MATPIQRAALLFAALSLNVVASPGILTEPSRIADRVVVSGRVEDFVTREPLAGAVVQIRGMGRTKADALGQYRLEGDLVSGRVPRVVVRAAKHWRRHAWLVRANDDAVDADWQLLPKKGPFNMALYNAVVRASVSTARWETSPTFRILENQIECIEGPPSNECPTWRVLSAQISEIKKEMFSATVNRAAAAFTGGAAPGQRTIESVSLEPGTILTRPELSPDGFFTLVEHKGIGAAGLFPWPQPGSVIGSQVLLLSSGVTPTAGFLLRILTLGLGHLGSYSAAQCEALENLGKPTSLCASHRTLDPTELDALHGRLLYSRPVGNSRPDRDPRIR